MGRSVSSITLLLVFISVGTWVGCGGGSRNSGSSQPVPSSISLAPQILSLDLGAVTSLTATARNFAGTALNLTYTWTSSNPSIVSVSTNGGLCAGTWDNLAAPVVCTPSGIGSAQITATAGGITSAPVTIYVHPHIDQIVVSPLPQPPGTPAPGPGGCFSTTSTTAPAETQSYQAAAFSKGADISALVGPFTWSDTTAQIASLRSLTGPNGIVNGQAQVTAHVPGRTQIFASIANTNSLPMDFTTCPVQSISLALTSGGSSFVGTKGAGFTVKPTVIDTNQKIITGVPLTWISSQGVATVSTAGAVTNSNPGGASISAACTPPTCNANLIVNSAPAFEPVYAPDPITATWSSTSTTPNAPTVLVSSTGCSSPQVTAGQNCATAIIPISGSPATLGQNASTTNVPNSIRFNAQGTTGFVGSSNGLMQITGGTPPTLSLLSTSVKGKVLAISPDGRRVIVADTQDTPNQVFIYDGSTSTPTITNLLVTGATAAAFSPDNLKAFIAAHDPGSGANTLYVYSTQLPLQSATLGGTPSDIAFLGNGMFGYIAEGSQLQYLAMCNNPAGSLTGQLGTVSAPATLIRPIPGNSFLTFSSPNVARVDASVGGTPAGAQMGCPAPPLGPPNGAYTLTNTVSAPSNLGQGTFTPVAFAVSSDGQKAYALASNLGSLIVYDVVNKTTSTIPLVGNPAPLAGGLSPDGLSFYVTTSDSALHVINLIAGGDVQQLPIPQNNLCAVSTGTAPTCLPDLLTVP